MTDLKNLVEKYSNEARLATANDKVYKDQCVYTYETPFSPDGLYVCLNRFIGVARSMIPIYFDKTKSHLYLRIKMSRQEVTQSLKNNFFYFKIKFLFQKKLRFPRKIWRVASLKRKSQANLGSESMAALPLTKQITLFKTNIPYSCILRRRLLH